MAGHRWYANDGREFIDLLFSLSPESVAVRSHHKTPLGMGMTCETQTAFFLLHKIEVSSKFSFPGVEYLSET